MSRCACASVRRGGGEREREREREKGEIEGGACQSKVISIAIQLFLTHSTQHAYSKTHRVQTTREHQTCQE